MPGFVKRWQSRLAIVRQEQRHQKTWLLTLALFGLAGLITLSLLLIRLNTLNWHYELGHFIANFSHFAARIKQFWNVFTSITNTFPILIPLLFIVGVGLFSAVSTLIIIWIRSMSKLYKPLQEGVVVS